MDAGTADAAIERERGSSRGETHVRPGLRVRLFAEADIPKAREIMRQHHANTVFLDQPFSDTKLDRHMKKVLSRPPGMLGLTAEWHCVLSGYSRINLEY